MKNKNQINCTDCIGFPIRSDGFDAFIERGRLCQLNAIKDIKEIKLYILLLWVGEGNFFYDTETSPWQRKNLKDLLLKDSTDIEFIKFLNDRGILVVESCFCPIYRFFRDDKFPYERIPEVITLCFRRHILHILMINKNAPIIKIFANPRYLENGVPEIEKRILKNFIFHNMDRANKRFVKLVNSIT